MMYKLPKKRLIILSSNYVNWTLSSCSKGRQQTFGFMPKNRACSLDFPRVRVTYRLLLRLLLRKVHLFLYYLKIYKNYEHSSLELFYSVIYFIHKGGMTNVKRKNKISIKSISS